MNAQTDRTRRDVYVQVGTSGGDGSREHPYGSIQEMLDQHREDWGQVFLGPGIYREDILLDRDGMWFFPWKQYDVIIEGSITITGRNNIIRGLSFRSLDKAIVVKASAEDCELQNNKILALSDGGVGLHLEGGALTIGNIIDLQNGNTKGTTGLRLQPNQTKGILRIDHNRVAGAECGIKILEATDNVKAHWIVSHNEVRDCQIGVQGLLEHVDFRYNRIWRCGEMKIDSSDNSIRKNSIYEIASGSCQTNPDADKKLSDAPEKKRTLYVSSDAASGGDGTRENPFSSLQEALVDLLPGDTVTIGPGEYRETVTLSALAPPEHPIRIQCSERYSTVFLESSIRLEDCANVHIEGLKFVASPNAIRFDHDARYCIAKDCHLSTVKGKQNSSIPVMGPSACHNLIEDCIIEGNNDRSADGIPLACQRFNQHLTVRRCRISGYYCAVQTGYGSYPTAPPGYHIIENCEFFENTDGVHCKMTDGIIRNCHLHHNEGFGITTRFGARQLIEGNRIHHNRKSGIRLHSPSHLVRNNLIYQNQKGGILASTYMGEPYYEPPTSIFVVNNTLWRNREYAIRLEQGARLAWMRNIIVGESQEQPLILRENTEEKADWDLSGAIRMADFNLYYQGTVPLLTEHEGGEHDLYADPYLVDPDNGDFRLTEDSPARKAVLKEWSKLPPIPFGTNDDECWLPLGAQSHIKQ